MSRAWKPSEGQVHILRECAEHGPQTYAAYVASVKSLVTRGFLSQLPSSRFGSTRFEITSAGRALLKAQS